LHIWTSSGIIISLPEISLFSDFRINPRCLFTFRRCHPRLNSPSRAPLERDFHLQKHKKLGFPRMRKESGERRVFLPDFIQDLTQLGFEISIEEGYGSRSGYSFDDYKQGNPLVKSCSREQAHAQAYVMVLRSHSDSEFDLIPAGTCLISMLHYPTRPERVELLTRKGIKAIRWTALWWTITSAMMEIMKAVAWNGLEAALTSWSAAGRGCCAMTLESARLGSGMVGKHAVDAATKLGNIERNNDHIAQGGPGRGGPVCRPQHQPKPRANAPDVFGGGICWWMPRSAATPSKPSSPNPWIAWLPTRPWWSTFSVDPYTLSTNPPVVRGIEGIPMGSLNK
jgi:alanine dehydrogenase